MDHQEKRKTCFVAFLFILEFTFSKCTQTCESDCECLGQTMFCINGIIPGSVPQHITDLHLKEVTLEDFGTEEGRKLIRYWSQITKLVIFVANGSSISTDMFQSLRKLKYLAIQGDDITMVANLQGLQNLKTLNLSLNTRLQPNEVSRAFRQYEGGLPVLSNLQQLLLSQLYTNAPDPERPGTEFYSSLVKERRIKLVDISDINIERIRLSDLQQLALNGLETLIAQRIVLSLELKSKATIIFNKLKYIDVTGTTLLTTTFNMVSSRFLTALFRLLFCHVPNLETAILDGINFPKDTDIRHIGKPDDEITLDISRCFRSLNKISFASNRISSFNVRFTVSNATCKSLNYLDASGNGLRFLAMDIDCHFTNITFINISNNAFSKFMPLTLKNVRRGAVVDMSNNKIKTFKSVNNELMNIQYLNLASNDITFLEETTRKELDGFYKKNNFTLNLSENPFQCTCENLEFLSWIKTSAVVDRTNKNYHCDFNGQIKDIQTTAIEDTKNFCAARTRLIRKICVIAGSAVFVIIIIAVSSVIRKKIRLRREEIELELKCRAGDMPDKYFVYVCSCSEDDEFVNENILPNLNHHLRQITRREQQLICTRDEDCRLGFYTFTEVSHLIENSSVVLAVITKAFCTKRSCVEEFRQAFVHGKTIKLLMAEHVEEEEMPLEVQQAFHQNVYVSWIGDPINGHLVPDWPKLCKSIIEAAFRKHGNVE